MVGGVSEAGPKVKKILADTGLIYESYSPTPMYRTGRDWTYFRDRPS